MSDDFRVGTWLVQPSLNSISCDSTTTRLEPKVMAVLLCLASHPGEALSKETLLQDVWQDTFVTEDVLKHAISELRRAFEDDAREPKFIQTIPKRGYRLVAPVVPANGVARSTAQGALGAVTVAAAKTGGSRVWILAAGIAGAVVILAVLIWVRGRKTDAAGLPSIHSLAVLPLQNLSADPTQEYFSDGMSDALITDLAQIGSLKVISRTSSMQYKQTKKSLPEIAHELGVDGIIEGTVQRSGNRVRITAQLIYAPADKHLWARSYERDLRDIFGLEQDVAQDIAQQVQSRLVVTKQASPSQPRPVKPEVLEAYIQGNYHWQGRGRGGGDEEERKAAEYFQHAIDLDPSFAPAYIGLARSHASLSQDEAGNLTWRSAAEKAVELDPSSSDAVLVLGEAKRQAWDWKGAEEKYRRAIALNPNNAAAHDGLGSIFDACGRLEEGWNEFELAQQLDPNQDHLADPLYNRSQFDRAIEIRQRIALRDPGDGYNHYALAMNYAQKRMFKEFAVEMGQAAQLFGMTDTPGRLRHAYDQSRGEGVLRVWAKELEHFAANGQLYLPGNLAELHAFLGDKDRSFHWLEDYRLHHDRATAETTCCFKTNPWLTPLRSDPRFADFLRSVGLPQ